MPVLYKKIQSLYKQLFGSILSTLLTLLSLYVIAKTLPNILNWVLINATWFGDSAEDCDKQGACWLYIATWWKQFIYGSYPDSEIWRINLCCMMLVVLISVMLLDKVFSPSVRKNVLFITLLVFPLAAGFLMYGGVMGLTVVETRYWGGLSLTLVIAIFGIISSFPVGVLLAMGRMSKMHAIRYFCIGFIELWRGVPLITVLFMASVMFPLFMPEGTNVDSLLRVLVAVSLFAGAYMAEIVRGGLQAIPKGQYEAVEALNMGYWKGMYLVILPQAITIVIPGIVSAFISLAKETTLVYIIGLNDFLAMVEFTTSNADWISFNKEGYVFVGCIFWVICYSMSKYSQKLENAQALRSH